MLAAIRIHRTTTAITKALRGLIVRPLPINVPPIPATVTVCVGVVPLGAKGTVEGVGARHTVAIDIDVVIIEELTSITTTPHAGFSHAYVRGVGAAITINPEETIGITKRLKEPTDPFL